MVTLQGRVNGHLVRTLAAQVTGAGVPWPPVPLVGIDGDWWSLGGHHRLAAAVTAGLTRHPARVVDLDQVDTCPCGWAGDPGDWLTHPCTALLATT